MGGTVGLLYTRRTIIIMDGQCGLDSVVYPCTASPGADSTERVDSSSGTQTHSSSISSGNELQALQETAWLDCDPGGGADMGGGGGVCGGGGPELGCREYHSYISRLHYPREYLPSALDHLTLLFIHRNQSMGHGSAPEGRLWCSELVEPSRRSRIPHQGQPTLFRRSRIETSILQEYFGVGQGPCMNASS